MSGCIFVFLPYLFSLVKVSFLLFPLSMFFLSKIPFSPTHLVINTGFINNFNWKSSTSDLIRSITYCVSHYNPQFCPKCKNKDTIKLHFAVLLETSLNFSRFADLEACKSFNGDFWRLFHLTPSFQPPLNTINPQWRQTLFTGAKRREVKLIQTLNPSGRLWWHLTMNPCDHGSKWKPQWETGKHLCFHGGKRRKVSFVI